MRLVNLRMKIVNNILTVERVYGPRKSTKYFSQKGLSHWYKEIELSEEVADSIYNRDGFPRWFYLMYKMNVSFMSDYGTKMNFRVSSKWNAKRYR